MRKKINVEPGTKGLVVKAKAKTNGYRDWLLIISHVKPMLCRLKLENTIFCHACICLGDGGLGDEASINPITFGVTSHYDFFEATKKEKEQLRVLLREFGLKYIKGINRIIKR